MKVVGSPRIRLRPRYKVVNNRRKSKQPLTFTNGKKRLNSKRVSSSRQSGPPDRVWYDEETGAIRILLSREEVGLSNRKVAFLGKAFSPKEEVHITVVGRRLGQKLKEAIRNDPAIESQIERAIEKTDWSYQTTNDLYHLSRDKKSDSHGNIEAVHTESIILMVEVAGIEQFYKELSIIVGMELEVPPTHVTLYTYGSSFGIGLPNQATFEKYVTRRMRPFPDFLDRE